MLEEIRCCIMRNMASNKRSLSKWKGELAPVQQKRLDKEKIVSNKWTIQWAGDNPEIRFQVERWDVKMDVDLNQRTCTCRFWQISGMLCRHAIAAMAHMGLHPEEYVHPWLKMSAFRATYEEFIRPCQSRQFWAASGFEVPIPPVIKRRPGRPKKTRRKDENDNERPDKLSKKLYTMHCKRCGSTDHNVRKCPQRAPLEETEPVEINYFQSAPLSQQEIGSAAPVTVPEPYHADSHNPMTASEPMTAPIVKSSAPVRRIPGVGLTRRKNPIFRPVVAVNVASIPPKGGPMAAYRGTGDISSMTFMPTPGLNNKGSSS